MFPVRGLLVHCSCTDKWAAMRSPIRSVLLRWSCLFKWSLNRCRICRWSLNVLFKYIDGVKIDEEYVDFFNWSCLLFVFFISLERERENRPCSDFNQWEGEEKRERDSWSRRRIGHYRFQPMRRKGEKRERDSSSAQGGNKACFSC